MRKADGLRKMKRILKDDIFLNLWQMCKLTM